MIHSLRFQSMQNHRLLLLPSKIYKKYFFTLRCPIANHSHRLLPSKIPITRGRGQVSVLAGELGGDGRSGRGGETRRWRRPGGTTHVAHRGEEGAAKQGALQGGRSHAAWLPQLTAAEGQGAPGDGSARGVAALRTCGLAEESPGGQRFDPLDPLPRPAPNRTSKSGADRILERVDPPPCRYGGRVFYF